MPWITAQPWAWVSLVGVTIWWTLGFNAIIYLAGLGDISAEQYEAAELDGASKWQQFWNVTVPGLRPVMIFVITTTILASANMFGQSYLITQGAPGDSTRTAIIEITERGLSQYRMGEAAAMSYLLAIFLGADRDPQLLPAAGEEMTTTPTTNATGSTAVAGQATPTPRSGAEASASAPTRSSGSCWACCRWSSSCRCSTCC